MLQYPALPRLALRNVLTAAVLFAFAGILTGCPYTSPVPMGTEKLPVDAALLGRWIPAYGEMEEVKKSGKAPEELKNLYVEFDQTGPTTLNRVYGALEMDLTQLPDIDAPMLTATGFVTAVGGVRILNLREQPIDGEEKNYRFFRYAADDQFLQMWPVAKGLFRRNDETIEFDDPDQLHAFARERVNREGFFDEEFELYVRAGASVTADDLYSRGNREYSNGNYTEALPWLTAAADRESSLAQRLMGHINLSADKGVSPDTAKAVMYYERAAAQGDKWAQHNLADLLYEGYWTDEDGVKSFYRDPRQAVDWWMKASEKGLYQADYELAIAFLQSKGIQRDLHRARRYAVRYEASDSDREYGRDRLAKLIDYEIQRQAQNVPISEIECQNFNMHPFVHFVTPYDDILTGGLQNLWQQIRYPDLAERVGIDGRVDVTAKVDPAGTVVEAEVTRGVFHQLNEEALRIARTARFTPSMYYGIPVCRMITIPIKFDLPTAAPKADAVRDVNATSTAREAIQSVKATSRPSLLDQSTEVLILRNPSRESVRFRLVCTSPQGREKSFTVSLDPYGSEELGFLQGWEGNFKPGDVCTAFDGETSVWRVTF